MSLMDGVDLIGYALGGALLCVALALQWRRRLLPPREQRWFLLFGSTLLVMSLVLPGVDNRLLGFIGLWSMWLVGQHKLPEMGRHAVVWGVRGFALFVIADTLWHLGRPAWINPNIMGAILVLGLTFIGDRRWAGVWLIALICTGSRGAILSVALPLIWQNRAFVRRHRWTALALAAAGGLLLVGRTGTIQARLEHWAEALRLFAASPLVGWGPGNYVNVSTLPWQNHADNALLTLLAEQGLLGVLALAPLAAVVVLQWRRSKSPLVRLVLAAALLHNLVDDTWLQPWPALLLGLNLAMLWRTDEAVEPLLAAADPAGGRAAAPAATVGAALE